MSTVGLIFVVLGIIGVSALIIGGCLVHHYNNSNYEYHSKGEVELLKEFKQLNKERYEIEFCNKYLKGTPEERKALFLEIMKALCRYQKSEKSIFDPLLKLKLYNIVKFDSKRDFELVKFYRNHSGYYNFNYSFDLQKEQFPLYCTESKGELTLITEELYNKLADYSKKLNK